MILIGELLNGSRRVVARAIEERDYNYIKGIITVQAKNGASYIDLNAGTGKGSQKEKEDMAWLLSIAGEFEDIGICIDTSDVEVIKYSLPKIKDREIIINSISGEKERISLLYPILTEFPECKVICLTMDDTGIPKDIQKKISISEQLIDLLGKAGIKHNNLFIDPLVQPISTDTNNGIFFLESLRSIKREFPSVMTTCGLSNISFGLPNRFLINKYFLTAAIFYGLDSAIADPLDSGIKESISLANVLSGKDEYCLNYIRMFRENRNID